MSYQALARKWRPRRFSELVGQRHVVQALTNALDAQRVHHAFLFTGTRGVGKTTVARILAKCLNCESGPSSTPCGKCTSCEEIDAGRHVDLIEVDAASRAKVDETRELMSNVQFAPTRARFKVYLIDEVHMFSDASFNALLKTLEEPPEHVKFLLATTDPQRMPVTVLSRCLQFSLKRLPVEQIVERLEVILNAEAIPFDAAAVRALARAADGSLRDALSLLDQAIVHGEGEVREPRVRDMLGLMDRRHIHALISSLADGDGLALLEQIDRMAGDVADWGEVLAEWLSELKAIAVAQLVPQAHGGAEEADLAFQRDMANRLPSEEVQLYYQIALIGRRDLPLAPDPRSGFEMTALRMLAFTPEHSPGGEKQRARSTAEPVTDNVVSPGPEVAEQATGADAGVDCGAALASAAQWADMAMALPITGLARELALNAECAHMDDQEIVLRVAPEHAALGSGRPYERLVEALGNALPSTPALRIEVEVPQGETPAQILERETQQRTREAEQALRRDPGVRALIDEFGARIAPQSIRASDKGASGL